MASDKWVAILGAGREQIPAIRAIKRAGYKCVGFDSDAKAAGRNLCDASFFSSNRNVKGIEYSLRTAQNMHVVGYLAAGSEVAMEVAALSGIGEKTARLCRDKLLQKETLARAGVPHTPIVPLKHKLPLVVKPRFGSGSRGVTLVRRRSKMLQAIDKALSVASSLKPQAVLYEEYRAGPQVSTETLIFDDEAIMVAMVDRLYEVNDRFTERGISAPSEYEQYWGHVEDITIDSAKALGMRRGVLKCDVVLSCKGPKIIECHPRLGPGVLQECVRMSSGVDYLPEAVRIACGEEPRWENLKRTRNEKIALHINGDVWRWDETRHFIEGARIASVNKALQAGAG